MAGDRYPHKLFRQVWKPFRGYQRKIWSKVIDGLFSSLGLDKVEWIEDIRKGECSLKSVVGESTHEWERRKGWIVW